MLSNSKSLIALLVAASTLVSASAPSVSSGAAQDLVNERQGLLFGRKALFIPEFTVNEIFEGKLNRPGVFGIPNLVVEKAFYNEGGYIVTSSRIGKNKVQFICGDDRTTASTFRFFMDAYTHSESNPALFTGTEYVTGPTTRIVESKVECFLGTQSNGGTSLDDLIAEKNISTDAAKQYIERISKGLQYMRKIGWIPTNMDYNFVGDKTGYLFYRSHADSVDLNSKDLSPVMKDKAIKSYNEKLWEIFTQLYKIILNTKDVKAAKKEAIKNHSNLAIAFGH
ncbi:hypothetical protein BDF19DRAFT_494195 [Syncephalis fuscata]|nr:hypothetical protein BDF19DRAFT_494195 [Syncephalis fuscata]